MGRDYRARLKRTNPDEFYRRKRNARLKNVFGLTPERYDELLAKQGGGCGICGAEPSERFFDVDHNHQCCPGQKSCGKCIRGLLCNTCNRAIGLLKDDPVRLRKTLDYLGCAI